MSSVEIGDRVTWQDEPVTVTREPWRAGPEPWSVRWLEIERADGQRLVVATWEVEAIPKEQL